MGEWCPLPERFSSYPGAAAAGVVGGARVPQRHGGVYAGVSTGLYHGTDIDVVCISGVAGGHLFPASGSSSAACEAGPCDC